MLTASDTVEINTAVTTVCDVEKVANVMMFPQTPSNGVIVKLANNLEVTGDFRGEEWMLESVDHGAPRQLTVSGADSLFSLNNGALQSVKLLLSSQTAIANFWEANEIWDATIINYGLLRFGQTPVSSGTTPQPSSVTNKSNGRMEVLAGVGFPGSIVNEGELKFTMENATTGADVKPTLENTGTVRVYDHTLAFLKWVSQTSGEFQLRNATVQLASSQPLEKELYIGGGSLTGVGTVIGSVVFGQTNSNGSPTLSPGIDDGNATTVDTGTILVTQNFTINTGLASVQMEMATGSNFDKLSVGGTTTLDGTLCVMVPATYNPALDTKYTFIHSIELVGDFDTRTLSPAGLTWQHADNPGKTLYWDWELTGSKYSIVVKDMSLISIDAPPLP